MRWIMPEKTEWAIKQNQHEPTRSYGQEMYDLVKTFPYNEALEIGSAWGVSALAILMAQPSGNLTSVDPDRTHAYDEIEANNFEDRWQGIMSRSNAFWESNQQTYDLIYIDGSHRYDDFKLDIFEAWKILNPNGLVICDDFVHPANYRIDKGTDHAEYGISLAAWEFIKAHNITKVHTTSRLLYFYKAEQ